MYENTYFADNVLRGVGFDTLTVDVTEDFNFNGFDLKLSLLVNFDQQGSGFNGQHGYDCMPCYCPGTRILTDRGEVAVEALNVGDALITIAGTAQPIRWIGRRSYGGRFLAGHRKLLPILIHAGAFGGGLPRRDLRVSPLHAIYLDGVLVPAGQLINGVTIVQETNCQAVEYIHVELAQHAVIFAEGAPSETFLDDGSRAMFDNHADFAQRYPDAPKPGAFCAPRVESGYQLEAIRKRLNALVRPLALAA